MEKFLIKGGRKLEGSVKVNSSKNAYLPILAGCILSNEKITLHNCPKYADVLNMIKILENLGGKITPNTSTGEVENGCDLLIDCSNLHSNVIPHDLTSVIRSSIFSLGAILGRFKKRELHILEVVR